MTDPSVQMADPIIQCNPMTARGSFLQVSGLQLQPRVGGGRSGRDGIDGSASFPPPQRLRAALLHTARRTLQTAKESAPWEC